MNTKPVGKTALELVRYFKASPERVYAAWTDPKQLPQWFGPENVKTRGLVADVRVGGEYRWEIVHTDGEEMSVYGEYRELVPGRKIAFTWRWDDDEVWAGQLSIVTVELTGRDGGTELHLRHEQLPSDESRERHTQGWESVLDQLEKFVS